MTDNSRYVEQKGVYFVGYLAGKLNCLFRQVKEHDKGVDAELELPQTVINHNSMIGIQVKARSAFKNTSDNKISITVSEQNLRYWKSFGRPVILMVYSDYTGEPKVYWTRADNASARTIKVDLAQEFDEHSVNDFAKIISEYHGYKRHGLYLKDVFPELTNIASTVEDVLEPVAQKIKDAQELFEYQKFQKSAQIYEALATIYEEVVSIWYNWAICLLEDAQYERALEIANVILEKLNEDWTVYHLIGLCHSRLEKYEEAEANLAKALHLAPLSSEVWNSLGLLHYWQGQNVAALEEFQLAAVYDPDEFVFLNLALCSTAMGNYEEALNYYDKCIECNAEFYHAFNNKGLLLRLLWRIWDALDCYDKAIGLSPENPMALYNSAYLLKDLGYNERAIQRYQMALDIRPEDEHIHRNLGLLFCRIGDFEKAIYHFRNSLNYFRVASGLQNFDGEIVGLIDIGYEVAYIIRLVITGNSIRIFSIDPRPRLAMFNGLAGMRERLEYASELNMSFFEEEPMKVFSPTSNHM